MLNCWISPYVNRLRYIGPTWNVKEGKAQAAEFFQIWIDLDTMSRLNVKCCKGRKDLGLILIDLAAPWHNPLSRSSSLWRSMMNMGIKKRGNRLTSTRWFVHFASLSAIFAKMDKPLSRLFGSVSLFGNIFSDCKWTF